MEIESRDIPGFPGYRAAIDGSIWGNRVNPMNKFGEWRKLSTHLSKDGYAQVCLRRPGKRPKRCQVHRLVLEAFVGPCPPGMESLHGPKGRKCNEPSNLKWGTKLENAADRFRDGTEPVKEKNGNAKLNMSIARSIRAQLNAGRTQQSVADEFGTTQVNISRIARNELWKENP